VVLPTELGAKLGLCTTLRSCCGSCCFCQSQDGVVQGLKNGEICACFSGDLHTAIQLVFCNVLHVMCNNVSLCRVLLLLLVLKVLEHDLYDAVVQTASLILVIFFPFFSSGFVLFFFILANCLLFSCQIWNYYL
jgi:hypothetical protein